MKDNISGKWIIIPIEIKARSFLSRLLLALYASKNGYNVIIGDQTRIHLYLKSLPRGIYFDKSISKNKFEWFKKLKKLGFKLTAIDEEGLVSAANKWLYLKQRISVKTLSLAEYFFVWGKQEYGIVEEILPDSDHKIIVSGNPRFDLLKVDFRNVYKKLSNRYNEMYGDYILFPTSFGMPNARGSEYLLQQARNFKIIESHEDEQKYRELMRLNLDVSKHYYNMICEVASEFKEKLLIIRPHPAEKHDYWKELEKRFSNIKVIYEGDVRPWLLGAEIVVHSSCTTGLEAVLLESPKVITFLPNCENVYTKHISNSLSWKCFTINEVKDEIRRTLDKKECFNVDFEWDKLEFQIANVKNLNSFEIIIDKISNINIEEDSLRKLSISFLKKCEIKLREFKRSIFNRSSEKYINQKQPGIKLDEVTESINELTRYIDTFKNCEFKTEMIEKDIFCISVE
jgi:surface carbohydrate biosynthesis protein